MIIVTTPTIMNKTIIEEKGIVTSSVKQCDPVAQQQQKYTVEAEVDHRQRFEKLYGDDGGCKENCERTDDEGS